mmetsp:Transcript_33346/g.84498  ORF Transcript_33346/g.84498 Transcript_33346/m.84498 type:complete len:221 (+) Transcript_33346:139-801(+)
MILPSPTPARAAASGAGEGLGQRPWGARGGAPPRPRQGVACRVHRHAAADAARARGLLMLASPAGGGDGSHRHSRRQGLLSHFQPGPHPGCPHQPHSVHVAQGRRQGRHPLAAPRPRVAAGGGHAAAVRRPHAPLPAGRGHLARTRLLHVPRRLRRGRGPQGPALPHPSGLDLLHPVHLQRVHHDGDRGRVERQPARQDTRRLVADQHRVRPTHAPPRIV